MCDSGTGCCDAQLGAARTLGTLLRPHHGGIAQGATKPQICTSSARCSTTSSQTRSSRYGFQDWSCWWRLPRLMTTLCSDRMQSGRTAEGTGRCHRLCSERHRRRSASTRTTRHRGHMSASCSVGAQIGDSFWSVLPAAQTAQYGAQSSRHRLGHLTFGDRAGASVQYKAALTERTFPAARI